MKKTALASLGLALALAFAGPMLAATNADAAMVKKTVTVTTMKPKHKPAHKVVLHKKHRHHHAKVMTKKVVVKKTAS